MGWLEDPKPPHRCALPNSDQPTGRPLRWQCDNKACGIVWEREYISDMREGSWWQWKRWSP